MALEYSIYQYHEIATNCDDLVNNGVYSLKPGATNSPRSGVWVDVIVLITNGSNQYVAQLAVSVERDIHVYARCLFGGIWSAWRTLAFA